MFELCSHKTVLSTKKLETAAIIGVKTKLMSLVFAVAGDRESDYAKAKDGIHGKDKYSHELQDVHHKENSKRRVRYIWIQYINLMLIVMCGDNWKNKL